MKKIVFIFFLCISCNSKKYKQTFYNYFPQNKEQLVVNDYSNLFTASQKDALARLLINYEDKTTNQIVIVTIDSISPYTNIQEYATAVGDYWGIGQKEKDNGLVIVLSNKLKQVGIATGYGTEKILTDSICAKIIDDAMIPHFKTNAYYKGINTGLDSIIVKWD